MVRAAKEEICGCQNVRVDKYWAHSNHLAWFTRSGDFHVRVPPDPTMHVS